MNAVKPKPLALVGGWRGDALPVTLIKELGYKSWEGWTPGWGSGAYFWEAASAATPTAAVDVIRLDAMSIYVVKCDPLWSD